MAEQSFASRKILGEKVVPTTAVFLVRWGIVKTTRQAGFLMFFFILFNIVVTIVVWPRNNNVPYTPAKMAELIRSTTE